MTGEVSSSPQLSFSLAHGQNQFFVELAEALAYELRLIGATATIDVGEIPVPREGLVHVFLPPHEYVALSRYRPLPGLLQRSIVISAEQPDSHYFQANLPLARDAGAVFDINPRSVSAYRAEGIEARALQLGHTQLWDRFEGPARGHGQDVVGRDIDILFLGRLTDRRACALASYAGVFERFRCHIGLSDNSRPNVASGAAFVAGEHKRALLARSKVLLNVHGEDEPYFEWLRIVEAICAGCAIVSEHSSDLAPLKAGTHLLAGELGSLGLLCAWLVEDGSRREEMSSAAYDLLARERPLAGAARDLLQAARRADSAPIGRDLLLAARQERARAHFRERAPSFDHQPPGSSASNGEALVLRGLKQQLLAVVALRRELAAVRQTLEAGAAAGTASADVVADSPAWASGDGRALTVIVPLYNHLEDVVCALSSLERSTRTDWELVVVDDGSSDGGGEAVREWMQARPQQACRLVRHRLNRGLAAARNTGIEHARTDRLLMLDADNELRRTALARLMDALDADPAASFAYGIMERFSDDGPEGLISCFGWDPERLRGGNYVDAFALICRPAIEEMGGYTYDPRLYGWEDYDLWVRMAEAGHHGVFVPEMIARYRVGHSSMISQTNLSTADAFAALVDHAPRLMANLRIPR